MAAIGLEEYLKTLRQRGDKAFVAYVTAGDPDIYATETIVKLLGEAGADVIELGVPFSDPVADGPTNQKAAERALAENTSLGDVLNIARNLRRDGFAKPLVLFTYYNPLFRMGLEHFAQEAAKAGVSGVLTVDLPPEEAADYAACLGRHGLDTVFLASPTTTPDRLARINELATGFVYYVSRTGVTGAQQEVSSSLAAEVAAARKIVTKPLIIGFGISTPEQARSVAGLADGVVVGSALVKLIEDHPVVDELAPHLGAKAKGLATAIKSATC